jgi:hypothetical protein
MEANNYTRGQGLWWPLRSSGKRACDGVDLVVGAEEAVAMVEGVSPWARFVVWRVLCGLRLEPRPSPDYLALKFSPRLRTGTAT